MHAGSKKSTACVTKRKRGKLQKQIFTKRVKLLLQTFSSTVQVMGGALLKTDFF